MASVSLTIAGGDKLAAKLAQIAGKLGSGGTLAVGFLEGATYPSKPDGDSINVASVAFFNEFGTTRAPPRPFFRRMIAAKSPQWGKLLATAAKKHDYDFVQTLNTMGSIIQGELVDSINAFTTPALAPSTVKRKGFSTPLVDTSKMVNSVDYEIKP